MEEGGGAVLLRPSGDLDLATVEPFRAMVQAALAKEPTALVLDLTDVTFLDSSGLAVLAVGLRSQRARGATFAVVKPQPIVRRAIELVGLGLLFDTSQVPAGLLEGRG
ncbi:MAG: STAS domain-containing protein [Mycobacteriales bacterium]